MDADLSKGEESGVIKSAKRVLEVFEFFAERRRPISVGELAAALNYPQSSSSVLLKSLVKLRYLDYDRNARLYAPTMRVALLGGWVHDQLFTEASLSKVIDGLHEASGQTVMLGMRNDAYVQYIYLVQGANTEIPWYIKPGSLRPLARSALGKVLLSRETDVNAMLLLRRINAEESDPANRVPSADLLRELDMIRQQGYAYTEGTVNPSAGVIAIELPTPASQPPMAVGIGAAIEVLRANRQTYLDMLREAVAPYQLKPQR
ncbi:IclR family transcriptional regulator [Cupriavidus basilensis]|uniref:IclR family transcriptional regulator n=1 Tax=Cupriavidus basilensis TaxID=68895 RepID=UPI001EEE4211|nr:helix-turn-helix domain-containing protein [Cupriavidus basilensis]